MLKLLRFIDWLIRLPDELERELRAELMVLAEEKSMAYVTSFERFAREEGREEGLDSERQLLLRLVRKRFNAGVMEHSRPLLGAIAEMKVLEDLAEAGSVLNVDMKTRKNLILRNFIISISMSGALPGNFSATS